MQWMLRAGCRRSLPRQKGGRKKAHASTLRQTRSQVLAMGPGTAHIRIKAIGAGGSPLPRVRRANPVASSGSPARVGLGNHDEGGILVMVDTSPRRGANLPFRGTRTGHERHVQLPGVWRRSRRAADPHDTRALGQDAAAAARKALHLHAEQQDLGSFRRDARWRTSLEVGRRPGARKHVSGLRLRCREGTNRSATLRRCTRPRTAR